MWAISAKLSLKTLKCLPNFFSKWGKAILSWYTPTFLQYTIVTFSQVQQLLANPQALQQLIQSVGGDMGEEGEEGEEGLPDDFGGMEVQSHLPPI